MDWDIKQVKWQEGGKFIVLQYCFIHHRARHEDGMLKETMKLVVSHGDRNVDVYRKVIEFDRDRFRNLLDTKPERACRPRREELVGLAERILGRRSQMP